jgi:leucyl/phenylalanyl-tRNA--protein transferase
MQKVLRTHPFTISCDRAFTQVMYACAGQRNYTNETWISEEIIEAYSQLHSLGYAHSIEVWQNNTLVGGLYGVALGCIFFGESMFSLVDNASKIAFITLCNTLAQCGFELIDCQVYSEHLASLGANEIPRSDFQQYLQTFTIKEPNGSPWDMLNHHE